MGESTPELEQRIAASREAIGATIDALAYRVDFKKRFPEYAESLVAAASAGALHRLSRAAQGVAHLAGAAASSSAGAARDALHAIKGRPPKPPSG